MNISPCLTVFLSSSLHLYTLESMRLVTISIATCTLYSFDIFHACFNFQSVTWLQLIPRIDEALDWISFALHHFPTIFELQVFSLSFHEYYICRMHLTCFSDRGCYFQVNNSLKLGMSTTKAFKAALETWTSWVETSINTNRTKVFFRTFESSHWRYHIVSSQSLPFCVIHFLS